MPCVLRPCDGGVGGVCGYAFGLSGNVGHDTALMACNGGAAFAY